MSLSGHGIHAIDEREFGDGSDGDVTVNAGVTLVRDMHYNSLTLAAGGAINTACFRIRVKTVLDLSAADAGAIIAPTADGNDAIADVGGLINYIRSQISWGDGTIASGVYGSQGGNGGTTTGGATDYTSYSSATRNGGRSGRSGGGGNGSSGNGHAGYQDYTKIELPYRVPQIQAIGHSGGVNLYAPSRIIAAGNGGNGGGGGGGDGANKGGGAGGGGAGGSELLICARVIDRGSNATASILQAIGGKGGNAANASAGNCGGGGGGGGAGGGWIFLVYESLIGSTIANALDVTGGDGGTGGTGTGTGTNGTGGYGGAKGSVWKFPLGGTLSMTATGTEQANSGTTGGTGESGLVDL